MGGRGLQHRDGASAFLDAHKTCPQGELQAQQDSQTSNFLKQDSPLLPLPIPILILLLLRPLLPLSLALDWFKQRDNLWRNSKRQESRDYPERKTIDDGIFKGLPEMIACVFGFEMLCGQHVNNFSSQIRWEN